MMWVQLDPRVRVEDAVGLLPTFLSTDDERGACEQFAANYCGGWHDSKVGKGGFTMADSGRLLLYPGDPPIHALAMTTLRKEVIVVYEHAYVAIIQENGTFRVARLD